MKIEGGLTGFVSGTVTIITVNWSRIVTEGAETAILALIGGLFGAIGGLIIAIIAKKIFKINKL